MCSGPSSRFPFSDKFLHPMENLEESSLEIMLQRIRKNFNIRDNEIADIPLIFACNSKNRLIV